MGKFKKMQIYVEFCKMLYVFYAFMVISYAIWAYCYRKQEKGGAYETLFIDCFVIYP